jgi:hypothetical protein
MHTSRVSVTTEKDTDAAGEQSAEPQARRGMKPRGTGYYRQIARAQRADASKETLSEPIR